MFDLRRLHPSRWNLRIAWDVLMVWLALVNVGLILFDMTYLLLRPTYLRWTPGVTRVYDPVLGISPHPLTEALIEEADELDRLLALDPDSAQVAPRVDRLRSLTLRVVSENPFARSGQERSLEVIEAVLARTTSRSVATEAQAAEAVHAFWSSDPAKLARNLATFDERIRPLLRQNYYRELTLDGKLYDRFWLIDLPFLTLFLSEFAVQWWLAIRRREYARWYFYALFHWYDLLGLVPFTQFRVFRLFRVASIYMRLRRSELSRVGRDSISRAVAYVSNIVAEEISDAVSLRILRETQDEIRDGTGRRIVDETLAERRGDLERVLVRQIRTAVASEALQQRVRALLRLNLDQAVERAVALRAVPLPNVVLRPLVRATGEVVLGTTFDTVVATLDSEEGEQAARAVAAGLLDHVLEGPWRAELDTLAAEISLDVLDKMKAAVSVKKWAHEKDRHVEPLPAPDEGRGERTEEP